MGPRTSEGQANVKGILAVVCKVGSHSVLGEVRAALGEKVEGGDIHSKPRGRNKKKKDTDPAQNTRKNIVLVEKCS